MKTKPILLCLIFFSFTQISFSQDITERYNQFGEMYVPKLSSAPFPHSARENGHLYNNKTFSSEEHYSDSSVAIFIPKNFRETQKINIVVYFHGWYNNIDKTCSQYKLIEQFCASNKNAILVFPQGPKNSPDGHGGNLEENNGLQTLIDDVLNYLVEHRKLDSKDIGNIILAGHSGAYRVISFCLANGGLTNKVSDVILFDALYGQTKKYTNWIEQYKGRFINIYTHGGGTKNETEKMMKILNSNGIAYFQTNETELKQKDLIENLLIFIQTDLNHNEVVSARKQFQTFITTSSVETMDKN